MATVYIETSFISHVAARPSTDIQVAALQKQARDWWAIERSKFDLVTSQLVISEASASDDATVAERLTLLNDLPLLPTTDEAVRLADALLAASLMPLKAAADALHVATAAVGGVE